MKEKYQEIKQSHESKLNVLFYFITRIFCKKHKPEYKADFIEYGYGYRGRKLLDGRYVLEKKGSNAAIDLKSPCYEWLPTSPFYKDCIANNAKELNTLVKTTLASRGI